MVGISYYVCWKSSRFVGLLRLKSADLYCVSYYVYGCTSFHVACWCTRALCIRECTCFSYRPSLCTAVASVLPCPLPTPMPTPSPNSGILSVDLGSFRIPSTAVPWVTPGELPHEEVFRHDKDAYGAFRLIVICYVVMRSSVGHNAVYYVCYVIISCNLLPRPSVCYTLYLRHVINNPLLIK